MKKSDLREGMIVRHRDGKLNIVGKDNNLLYCGFNVCPLSVFNEDLTCNDDDDDTFDIVEVYDVADIITEEELKNRELLWKREKKYTYLDKFVETFPNPILDNNGLPKCCPNQLWHNVDKINCFTKNACSVCWNRKFKEQENNEW